MAWHGMTQSLRDQHACMSACTGRHPFLPLEPTLALPQPPVMAKATLQCPHCDPKRVTLPAHSANLDTSQLQPVSQGTRPIMSSSLHVEKPCGHMLR